MTAVTIVEAAASGTAAATLDRIEQRITRLVQSAPDIEAGAVDELREALREIGSPLALVIARVVELVAEHRIDPGIALPPLAMACATLADGVRGALGERELEAARYEIETLLPDPSRIDRFPTDPPARSAAPHVPLSALRRRPP